MDHLTREKTDNKSMSKVENAVKLIKIFSDE